MKDNKTKKWSIGLQFVQFQKNSSHHRVIVRSPYEAVFGNNLKVLQKLVTEEDFFLLIFF
jgi:hypothetical protein